jgi:hypothetical protein
LEEALNDAKEDPDKDETMIVVLLLKLNR